MALVPSDLPEMPRDWGQGVSEQAWERIQFLVMVAFAVFCIIQFRECSHESDRLRFGQYGPYHRPAPPNPTKDGG